MADIFSLCFRLFARLRRLGNVATAKKAGLKIGVKTILVGDQSFGSEPFLIEIGESCLITDGVRFVTHDGAIQVPLIAAGEKIEDIYSKKSTFARIRIGNNVFVGVSSIILPGSTVGDNSIVAAGSIVRGVFPSGVVIGGQPAKVIGTIEDYRKRNSVRLLVFCNDVSREEQILMHLDGVNK